MLRLRASMYYSQGANDYKLSEATYIADVEVRLLEIFDLATLKATVNYGSSTPITNDLYQTNDTYATIIGITELESAYLQMQYNSAGDMGGINALQSLFAHTVVSSSTEYKNLYFDFGDYYMKNSGTSSWYTKDEVLVSGESGGIAGSHQYNVSYNNIGCAIGMVYEDKIYPMSLTNTYTSAYSGYLDFRFNKHDKQPLGSTIGDYLLGKAYEDPLTPGGISGGGGGQGSFSGTGDDISIPSLPTLSAADTGFITLFNPTGAQMKALANYMWSNPLFDLSAWKKIFADPMDAVLGLSIVPVAVPDGGAKVVAVGNISTGVSMNTAASQYVEVDCGSLYVEEYWGAYLDYAPFTKAEIYLPYIGSHAISVDDIMDKNIHVVYHVDILSGSCTAFVQCGGSVLYTFIGHCSSSIPITGDNWTNVVNGALNIAGSIGNMVASGGLSSPVAPPPGTKEFTEWQNSRPSTSEKIGAGISGGASLAQNVISMKPEIEKSGSMSGTGGMLGVQVPYLILTRPRQALPKNQSKYSGYPAFMTVDLGSLRGYTEIFAIHLENIPCTGSELSEIETLLKGGVIF